MGPILHLYYEESLVSSNLNSKLFLFHSVRPNKHPEPKKFALNLELEIIQILTNDVQTFILCLSYIITTVFC